MTTVVVKEVYAIGGGCNTCAFNHLLQNRNHSGLEGTNTNPAPRIYEYKKQIIESRPELQKHPKLKIETQAKRCPIKKIKAEVDQTVHDLRLNP
jgi:hypothetical protein